jgi:hypothetical protein
METQKKGKTGLMALAAIVILAGGYYFYARDAADNGISTTVPLNTEEAAIGKKLLVSLNELKGLKLDSAFFDNALFVSLQDFSVTLVPVPVGRPNPFLPTGASSASASAGAALAQ